MRRASLAFTAVLVLTTACGASDPTLEDSASREVEPLDRSTVADATGPSPTTVPAKAPTVRLAVPDDWSIDPADAGAASITNRVVADLLYEGLTRLDSDGTVLPALAERWFVSEDRLTWTFVLPESLTDGAGESITARDVKVSLERIAARGPSDQAATALTSIAGWQDRMTGEAGGVAGISAPDATTLVVQLATRYELLLEVLAAPAFGITGEAPDGGLRTTGAFRATDEPGRFEAIDSSSSVADVVLVNEEGGPGAAVAAGTADWAVLTNGEGAGGLPADIVRQPLELEVAVVVRTPSKDGRLGLLAALEPRVLATTVKGLTARVSPRPSAQGETPETAILDLPTGSLAALGAEIVEQLEAAGVDVITVASDPVDFAGRVASGEAVLFPIVIAGGTGPASALLRAGVPGASDDVFGPSSAARVELAAALAEELDLEQRALFADALERELVEAGLLLPIGQFEVRIAMGHRLDGLRHRADGTLDLTAVELAQSAS